MNTEKLLNEMAEELGNNRGLAERALNLFDNYGLAKHIEENREDYDEMDWDGELIDAFFDLAYRWETQQNCDDLLFFIDLLTAFDYEHERSCGRGRLAELMVIYYNNL